MSKKSILSTLLISSALLGTISASATTSAIRPEKKLVSVEKSNAKIYKNSKLQESKKAKQGTVYKVDGYRNINSKKYYRVYQEDAKGKVVYKGYILDKDTKVLKGQKPAKKDRLVALTKDDQTAWKSLYFNKKIKTYDGTKHSSNFEVKYSYNIGGKKYFSLYRGEKWMGYMDGSAFKVLTPKTISEDKQDYKVVKDYDTYSDIYFTENGQLTKGEDVKVKRIYTFGTGRQYGSVYNKDGKWLGYANMSALETVETSTPEKPEEKPDGNKPGTGGDTSKPENPGDKPTDKPDGDKPGQGGDNKPGGDQGGSGSGDTGNQPGDGGTGDSGSGSQPGGGDQGGNPGTGGGDQGGSGDTGTGGNQPSQPGQPDNPGTGGGTETPEQPKPEAPKPTESDIKALKDAVEKAKKVVDAKDKLNGVTEVETALKKAEEILKKQEEGKATKAEVVNVTKEIEAAIKGITLKPSINKDSIIALHNAIEQLKETQKLGAGNLVNNDNYQKVLEDAEKVLKDAVNGKADKKTIEAETKKVNDFINKLQLNTKALEEKINVVKVKGDKVYMTKEQETKFNEFIAKAQEAAKNTQLSNTNKLKEIDENLKKAEDFIKGQPTEVDVKELIKATEKAQEVATQLKGKEDQIFQNWDDVKTKDEAADKMLKEIKEDKSPTQNNATVAHTAKEVQDAAKALMDSMANLEVNHDNLKKYDQAAKEAIADLDEAHKEAAQNLLTSFEVVAGDANVKDLDQMIKVAKKLNKEIHDDQVQEINDVIKKAQRIEGVSSEEKQGDTAPNAKFYESTSYNQMNTALTDAEAAEKKLEGEKVATRSKRSTSGIGATQVQNGKEAATKEKELKDKIEKLQVKDWQTKEVDGKLQLVKYTGDYTKSTDEAKQSKDGTIVIEVPGSLKDEQVVLENTNSDKIFPSKDNGTGQVEIRFEENSNRKVQTNGNMNAAMANNKSIGIVDFTGLDTSNVTTFNGLFLNNFNLKEVKGEENLVSSKATDLSTMFCNTKVSTLNTSGWNTSNVTDMERMFNKSGIQTINGLEHWNVENVTKFQNMFGGTDKLKTLDLSGWSMEKADTSNTSNMFISKDGRQESQINKVILPDANNGRLGQGPKLIVEALIKAEGQNGGLSHNVEVWCAVDSKSPEKIGVVQYVGNKPNNDHGEWKGEGKYSKENIITTDSKILNDPVALCSVVMGSEGDTATDTAAKNLAKLLDKVAYPVWTYSTGHKVIKSRDKDNTVLVDSGENDVNNQGINNNTSWSSFEKNGSGHYYKAIKLLQDYAQNKTSITADQAKDMMDALIGDFQGMQVITEDLQDLVAQAKARKEDSKDMVSLIKKAQDCIEHPKLDNWKNIVETTKELRGALADKK